LFDRGFALNSDGIRCAGFLLQPDDRPDALPSMMSESAVREAVDEFAQSCLQLPPKLRRANWNRLMIDAAGFPPAVARLHAVRPLLAVKSGLSGLSEAERMMAQVAIDSACAAPYRASTILRQFMIPAEQPRRDLSRTRMTWRSLCRRVRWMRRVRPVGVLSLRGRATSDWRQYGRRSLLERAQPGFDTDWPRFSRFKRLMNRFAGNLIQLFFARSKVLPLSYREKQFLTALLLLVVMVAVGVISNAWLNSPRRSPHNPGPSGRQTISAGQSLRSDTKRDVRGRSERDRKQTHPEITNQDDSP
jgi:hypothetical protein